MKRPLLLLSLLFCLGNLMASLKSLPISILFMISGVLFTAGFLLWFKQKNLNIWFLAGICFLLGMIHYTVWQESNQTPLMQKVGKEILLQGVVCQEPDVREGKVSYTLTVEKVQERGTVRTERGLVLVSVYQPQSIYSYGDRIEVKGILKQPESPGNPGQFDYQRYLARRGIHLLISSYEDENVKKLAHIRENPWREMAYQSKERLQALLQKTLPPEQSALMQGMLFGSTEKIPDEISRQFQAVSLVHILSVSGYHVGILLAAFLFITRIISLPRLWEGIIGTVLLLFYAFMTGLGPAIIRATVMGIISLWGMFWGREKDWPIAMALAGAVVLFVWPAALWDPGCQLSFMVTWGILYLTPKLEKLFSPLPISFRLVIAVSLAAELTAAPLVAYHFNMLSLVGVVTNILLAPVISMAMLISLSGMFVGLIWLGLAQLISASGSFLIDLMLALVQFFSSLPHGIYYLSSPPVFLILCYYAVLFFLPYWIKKDVIDKINIKLTLVTVVCLIIGWLFWIAMANDSSRNLTVHFIDVGQGDAAFIQTPSGKNMLIDAGGWPGDFAKDSGAGSKVVVPYLQRQGVNNLDVVVISHPHEDHAAGMRAVIKTLPVKLAILTPSIQETEQEGSGEKADPGYIKLRQDFKQRGVPVQVGLAGETLVLDPQIKIKILAPSQANEDFNEGSLVLKIIYGEKSFLFTGDIGPETEMELLKDPKELKSDVLKVPHHGSKNFSPEFFSAVAPSVGVISVGAHNRFGHPGLATLNELEALSCRTYRTDKNGVIRVTSDGRQIFIDTGRKSK